MKIAIIASNQKGKKWPYSRVIQTCRNIQYISEQAGHRVTVNVCNSRQALQRLVDKKPDLVLLMNQSIVENGQQDINLIEYFISQGINVSGTLSGNIHFKTDLVLSQLKLKSCGINSVRDFMAAPVKLNSIRELAVPLPLNVRCIFPSIYYDIEGSKSVDSCKGDTQEILKITRDDEHSAIVEESLNSQSYACAVIHSKSQGFVVSVIESRQQDKGSILFNRDSVEHIGTRFKIIGNKQILGRIKGYAIQIFNHLGFRDYAMINIMMNSSGDFYFIRSDKSARLFEHNSVFTRACKLANNLTYDAMISLMLEGGIVRAPTTMAYARDYAIQAEKRSSWADKVRNYCFGSV